MTRKAKKGRGVSLCIILLISMFVFFDTRTISVKGETFGPFTEDFTTISHKDTPFTNVSGWGTGSIYNTNKNPEFIGSIGSGLIGSPTEIYIHGDIALIGDQGSAQLKSIDISNPTNPILNDSISLSSIVMNIQVENNFAYLALYNHGFRVVNITDPNNMGLLGYSTPSGALSHDTEIFGDYAFLAVEYTPTHFSILTLEIDDPNTIVDSSAWAYETNGSVYDLEIKNSYIYAANGSSLLVLDISDPHYPSLYSEFTGLNNVKDITIYGNYAFIADNSGLTILDISNPESLSHVGNYAQTDLAQVIIDGTYAYLIDQSGDIYILDITNLSNIKPAGMYDYPGTTEVASAIFLHGCYLYVAALNLGMEILEVSNNIQPVQTDIFSGLGFDKAICIEGDIAYVVGGYFGGLKFYGTLKIYNISDPTSAELIGEYERAPGPLNFGHIFCDIEIYNKTAYIVGALMENALGTWLYKLALYKIDISDLTNPSAAGSPLITDTWQGWLMEWVFDLQIHGDYMYVACGFAGLAIYDFSNPPDPIFLSFYTDGGNFFYVADIHIVGELAYVADGANGLKILDMSNPIAPVRIGWLDLVAASYKVWIEGDLAYVAVGANGVRIINVEDPTSPLLLGHYNTLNLSISICVSGNTAFVSDHYGGLTVLDVTDSSNPELLYIYDINPHSMQDVLVKGDYAFAAELQRDFEIIEVRKSKARQFTSLCQAQSGLIFAGDSESSFQHATLTSSRTVPSGTSVSFFLSPNDGVNWEEVTPGIQHNFAIEGHILRWRAILSTTDPIVSPIIDSITLNAVTALASPEILEPADGYVTDLKTPIFQWYSVEDADGYQFQLDESPSFTSPLIDENLESSFTFYQVQTPLEVGTYYWRVAAEDYTGEIGYYSQPRSIIIELDISPPVIDHPNDFSYLQGTTGHTITWNPSDNYPDWYNITRDGVLLGGEDGVWDGSSISISVDGLAAGTYTYLCYVYDQFGLSSSDSVDVTVSVTQPPTIDNIADFDYEEGTTGHIITWNPSDNNPSSYNITRNGALVDEDTWDGSSISISVDGLSVGTYTHICTVYDGHGNSASDTVVVEVIEPIIPTINHPLDFEYESGSTGNTITWVPYDNNPDNYIVEIDGTPHDSGDWTGEEVTVNVDNLDVNSHTVVCTVFDIHGNFAEDTVIVTVVDTTNPTIDHPEDISYVFEETGNSITWQPRDVNPQSYVLTLDGDVIESDSWEGGDITVNVDGLEVGSHIYLVLVTDSSGNSVSDSVTVTVSEPATTPTTPTPTDEDPLSLFSVILAVLIISSILYYRKRK